MCARSAGSVQDAARRVAGADRQRVYVVEFHEIVRLALVHALEAAGMAVIGESASAVDASRRIPALRPDVVVIDDGLPDGPGAWLCARIRSLAPDTRCLILSGQPTTSGAITAVVAGAAGYLSKRASVQEVVRAVRQAGDGGTSFTGLASAGPDRHETGRSPAVAPPASWALLSQQERRILFLVGQGLTNRQISEHLQRAEQTVKNRITAILAKLELKHRTEAAVLAAQYECSCPWYFANDTAAGPADELRRILSRRLDLDTAAATHMLKRAVRDQHTTLDRLATDIADALGEPCPATVDPRR